MNKKEIRSIIHAAIPEKSTAITRTVDVLGVTADPARSSGMA